MPAVPARQRRAQPSSSLEECTATYAGRPVQAHRGGGAEAHRGGGAGTQRGRCRHMRAQVPSTGSSPARAPVVGATLTLGMSSHINFRERRDARLRNV